MSEFAIGLMFMAAGLAVTVGTFRPIRGPLWLMVCGGVCGVTTIIAGLEMVLKAHL